MVLFGGSLSFWVCRLAGVLYDQIRPQLGGFKFTCDHMLSHLLPSGLTHHPRTRKHFGLKRREFHETPKRSSTSKPTHPHLRANSQPASFSLEILFVVRRSSLYNDALHAARNNSDSCMPGVTTTPEGQSLFQV